MSVLTPNTGIRYWNDYRTQLEYWYRYAEQVSIPDFVPMLLLVLGTGVEFSLIMIRYHMKYQVPYWGWLFYLFQSRTAPGTQYQYDQKHG